jgi:UDP-3-O-[3-hydroxymyristoyl] glucosamine N-acyltransferase
MELTLKEIAAITEGELSGRDITVSGIGDIEDAGPSDIAFVSDQKYLKKAEVSKAGAFLMKKGLAISGKPFVLVEDTYLAAAIVLEKFYPKEMPAFGIHEYSQVSKDAVISVKAHIGAFVVIEAGSSIGDGSVIMPFSYIGRNVKIGSNTKIHPNTSIMDGTIIGSNVTIHSGSCVGADGFGYVKERSGKRRKIPQVGIVIIEDNVEIGANTCIDRAMLKATVIRKGAKIDNLVQIAHNAEIGENAIIAGQSGVSGSTVIRSGAILAGQVGIADHLVVGKNSIVLAQSGVSKDIPDGKVYWGYPADDARASWKRLAELKRFSLVLERVENLEKKIKDLEAKCKQQ